MKLSTKVYLATFIVATLGVGTVGASSVLVAYQSETSVASQEMLSDIALVDASSYDALSEALDIGQTSSTPISIAYLDNDKRVSLIHDDGPKLSYAPTDAELKAAAKKPIESNGSLISALKLRHGGHLVFLISIEPAKQHLQDNVARLLAIYLATVVAMFGLIWLTLRRDLLSIRRLRMTALEIAEGELDAVIPAKQGNSEIEELARSLGRMVDRLRKAIATEKQAKESIETFIGDASHELRTPLTVIRGYSELLTEPSFTGHAVAGQKIIREVDKMTSLVRDLLLLARLEETEPDLAPCDFLDLVTEAIENQRILEPKRQISAKLAPVVANSDRALIERFLANVFSNIARYVPENAPVEVALKARGRKLSLIVEDSGPGLPDSAYKQGIQSFKRFDASRSKESGGTGLGMSIMSSIAESLGGKVTLSKSRLGGLKVCLELPIN